MRNKFIIQIFLSLSAVALRGQDVICSKTISKETIPFEEIFSAVKMYKMDGFEHQDDLLLLKDPLILVDFLKENSLNKYRIYPDYDVWAPIFRQPDCILKMDSIGIIYLYTSEYKTLKDSIFLKILEQEISKAFQVNIKYDWENMILEVFPATTSLVNYDPPLMEYIFQNGILIESNNILNVKMFYEDTHIPPNYFLNYRVFDPRFPAGADSPSIPQEPKIKTNEKR